MVALNLLAQTSVDKHSLFEECLHYINENFFNYILLAALLSIGIYFSFKTKFVQIRLFGDSVRSLTEKSHDRKISSFQAMMISTASRVGTGNIVAVATGVILGGPGAVFWMWITALLGASLAFVESTLAQVYKVKHDNNKEFIGGPAYYMQKALNKRWLGIIFAVALIFAFSYGFNVLQSNSMSQSLAYYIPNYENTIWPYVLGAMISLVTAFLIFGGIHRIGFVTSYIVPLKALVYLALGFIIIIKNFNAIPDMFYRIFTEAFNFKSVFVGFGTSALLQGFKRGLLSNEAGMGSAPNAAASADVAHPVKQGAVQILSVYIDTFLICTTTAFIVLLSGLDLQIPDPEHPGHILLGINYVQEALHNQFGEFGAFMLTFSIFSFALSAIAGNYCYAESNIIFIKDNKKFLNIFRLTCIVAVFFACLARFEVALGLADVFMAILALINIVVITILGNIVMKCLKDYLSQKKDGKDPVFSAKKLGIENAELWDE